MDLIYVSPETSLCSLQFDAFLSASVSSWMVELSGQDWEVPGEAGSIHPSPYYCSRVESRASQLDPGQSVKTISTLVSVVSHLMF